MNRSAFEKQLQQDGFDEVLTKELEPKGHLEQHDHSWDVRGLVLRGEFTITTAEGGKTYHAGDEFYLPAGVPHQESQGAAGAHLLLGRRRLKN